MNKEKSARFGGLGKKYYEIDFLIPYKYLIYTKDYKRENGINSLHVYMTMFL